MQDAGPWWVVVLELGPGSHLAQALLVGIAASGAGTGAGAPLRGSPCQHPAGRSSREVRLLWAPKPALKADKPGKLQGEAEGQNSTGRCGCPNKTDDDEGRSVRVFFFFFLQTSFEISF